jgi:hypothetical protein
MKDGNLLQRKKELEKDTDNIGKHSTPRNRFKQSKYKRFQNPESQEER